jgi:hypothetical protein
MTEPERTSQVGAREKTPRAEGRRRRGAYPALKDAAEDGEAKRLCAIILEVLGGVRTPTDAAGALGVSAPRYYALEARALGGMLKACQRRTKGRKRTAESELEQLRRSHAEVARERDRLGALLRASQRAMGIPGPQKPERTAKKRKRRPQVRALRASRSLKEPAENTLAMSNHGQEDAVVVKG